MDVIYMWTPPPIVLRWLIEGREADRFDVLPAELYFTASIATLAAMESAKVSTMSNVKVAAREAARSSAWSAAWSPAWSARDVAWAAREAAREAARAAARDAQEVRLAAWLEAAHAGTLDLSAPLMVPEGRAVRT